MNRHITTALETVYALTGALTRLDIPDGKRVIGVDRLTGQILEQRVAIEATRFAEYA